MLVVRVPPFLKCWFITETQTLLWDMYRAARPAYCPRYRTGRLIHSRKIQTTCRHPCFNQQSGRYVGLHTALLRCSYRRLLCCVLNYWSPLSCLLWSNTPLNDISLQTHPLDFYFHCKKGKCLLYLFFLYKYQKSWIPGISFFVLQNWKIYDQLLPLKPV